MDLSVVYAISLIKKIYQQAMLHGSSTNQHRCGQPPIFDDAEKAWLIAFITCNSSTRRLSWEEMCLEMGCACYPRTLKYVVESLGYPSESHGGISTIGQQAH